VKNLKHLAVIFLLALIIIMVAPLAQAADTISKPTVTLPMNWALTDDTPYPDSVSEYDPAGAGLLEYTDQQTYDFVMIYYEKALSIQYTAASLQAEAESIYTRDHTDSYFDSGSKQYAGVTAGYAKGYNATVGSAGVYRLEVVFVKGGEYFNVYAYYDATDQAESTVTSLINSIDVSGGSLLGGSNLYIIVGAIVAIIVVVVVVVVLVKRRKKPHQASAPEYIYPSSAPPPPPPPLSAV
jgi:ABC-type glycerol-3-phosphate transport system permease component